MGNRLELNKRSPKDSLSWGNQPNLLLLQVINKTFDYNRSKILKEIDIFHHCQGHKNILQLNEYYEESEKFYLVFDMLNGGEYINTFILLWQIILGDRMMNQAYADMFISLRL